MGNEGGVREVSVGSLLGGGGGSASWEEGRKSSIGRCSLCSLDRLVVFMCGLYFSKGISP